MLALLDPSRPDIPEYAEYVGAIQRAARPVNDRYYTRRLDAVDLRISDNFPEAVAAYKHYDVLLVNAIFDGMNLIAKEAPLVNERDGVLILSENAGAHVELGRFALTVNPFDIQATADAIHDALVMPAGRAARADRGHPSQVREHDIDHWMQAQLDDLAQVAGPDAGAAVSARLVRGAVVEPVPRAGDGGGARPRSRRRSAADDVWRVELRPRRAARAGARSGASEPCRRGRAARPTRSRSSASARSRRRSPPACVAAHPDLALVWVDAHGDLNTPETTPSGFLGGMPFAILLGWCHDELRTAAGLDPALPEARAALVGARDLDPGERAAIGRSRLVVADDVAGGPRRPAGRCPAPRPSRRRRARPGGRARGRLPRAGRLAPAASGRRDGGARRDRPRGRREPLLRQPPPRPRRPLGARALNAEPVAARRGPGRRASDRGPIEPADARRPRATVDRAGRTLPPAWARSG